MKPVIEPGPLPTPARAGEAARPAELVRDLPWRHREVLLEDVEHKQEVKQNIQHIYIYKDIKRVSLQNYLVESMP